MSTIAVKWQYYFASCIFSERYHYTFKSSIPEHKKLIDLSNFEIKQVHSYKHFEILDLKQVEYCAKCNICNTKYEIRDVICLKSEDLISEIHLISYIINIEGRVYFVTKQLPIEIFDKHFDRYILKKEENILCLIDSDIVINPPTRILIFPNGKQIVKFKMRFVTNVL